MVPSVVYSSATLNQFIGFALQFTITVRSFDKDRYTSTALNLIIEVKRSSNSVVHYSQILIQIPRKFTSNEVAS